MLQSFFISDGKFYEQCVGIAMGSPLRPTLAIVFMWHFAGKLSCSFKTNGLQRIRWWYIFTLLNKGS